jgi:2-methylcitrate dehydratase
MQRIRVSENKEYTREFPGKLMTSIEVATRDGQRLAENVSYPKGHAKNPMTDADIESKFSGLAERVMSATGRDALLDGLWRIDQASDVGAAIDLVRVES